VELATEAGQDVDHAVQVDAGARPYRFPAVEHRPAHRHPGGHQPVHGDVEGQHVHPLGRRPDDERRAPGPTGTGGPFLANQADRRQLRGQRHDGTAVEPQPPGQHRTRYRTRQVYLTKQGAEIAPVDPFLGPPALEFRRANRHRAAQPCRLFQRGLARLTTRTRPRRRTTTEPGLRARERTELRTFIVTSAFPGGGHCTVAAAVNNVHPPPIPGVDSAEFAGHRRLPW
jgi:hypothetical protein